MERRATFLRTRVNETINIYSRDRGVHKYLFAHRAVAINIYRRGRYGRPVKTGR